MDIGQGLGEGGEDAGDVVEVVEFDLLEDGEGLGRAALESVFKSDIGVMVGGRGVRLFTVKPELFTLSGFEVTRSTKSK